MVGLDYKIDISNVLALSDCMHSYSSALFNNKAASFFGDDSVVDSSTSVHIIKALDNLLDAAFTFPQRFHHRIRTRLASAGHNLS